MPLPSSSPSTKVSVIPGNLPINIAAYSPDPAKFGDAFDQGLKTMQNVGDSVLLRPKQVEAAAAQADNLTDEAKAAMVLRPLIQRVAAKKAEADFVAASNDVTGHRITETALNHPDYQSSIVSAKIAVAEHAAREAQLELGVLEKTGADITSDEVLKARKKVRDAQYDLDTLADEQKKLDIKRGVDTKAVKIADTQANVALKIATDPAVQDAQTDTAKADIATGRLASLTNLARQVALGTISPSTISPEDDSKLRLAAQALGVNVIDSTGRPRPLAEISKEYTGKVALKDAEPLLKEIRDVAQASQGSLAAIQTIKGLGKVNTGFLYSLPGVTQFDRVLAQAGVDQSQKREIYAGMNSRLVPLVRQPGSVSNFEQVLYQRALPGPGVSEKTNAAMIAGLYSVAERATQRPAFYNALLGQGVPANEVEQIWSGYVDKNPSILDESTPNKGALTPQQYLAAVIDPAGTARSIAPSDPAIIATLPKGDTEAELAAAPATAPFVAIKNARGVEIAAANPNYWKQIVQAAQSIATPTPVSQQSSAYVDAFRQAQTTPIDTLLRAAPVAVPLSLPTGVPLRRRK